ncbi:MAG TPA: class III extradiol ring-cleavage dioxygenase [Burkholderiaceae bacterium]|nr:class III extradiol ring-cleavage dioxygenase [Burkholderiaceae bacterium]
MATQPTLFISHGSPMHAVHAGRAGALWAELGRRLARPAAILIASAHWETELPMVATGSNLETIHDFGGFPPELYRIKYPVPGAPLVAERALALLREAGFVATPNGCRGLDHGAWVPLLKMFPDADVPTAQVSVQPPLGPEHHLRLGAALAPLARENVLVIGSGHMTHNLGDWMRSMHGNRREIAEGGPVPYVEAFRSWVDQRLQSDNRAELVRYRELAPNARRAHPTDEHFLPLFVALGAAGIAPRVERIDPGVDSGVLAMDSYLFSPQ